MSYSVWLVLILGLLHTTPNKAVSVRLVNGSHSCSGRVEVFYSGQWGTVCDDDWNKEDGEVVCREMGCGPLKEEKKYAFFGEGSLPVLMTKLKCVNTESSLIDCPTDNTGPIQCDHTKDAGVICEPNVRLMDGFDSCSGRVEVIKDGHWGTVCDDSWDLSDAAVVCREVGCGDATEVKRGGYFGTGGQLKMHGVNCAGNELTLSSCVSANGAVDPSVCDISKSAGVVCQSLIRLVNGGHSCSGRVEVYHDGRWGTVCDNNWDELEGIVVCRELGCGSLNMVKTEASFGLGSGPVWISDLSCLNSESTVRHCQCGKSWGDGSCGHEKDVGVICEYSVRLTGGSTCSGVVEVYRGDLWGPVCYDGWDLTDAAVVCRELGCGDVIEVNSAPIQIPAVMNHVNCDGSESTLMRCGWSAQTCSSNLHAKVTCRSIKLVNGPSRCSGTVQILHTGLWWAVCDAGWDVEDARVVCREMGCSGGALAKQNSYFGLLAQQSWMTNVDCHGGENSLTECNRQFGSNLCGPGSHAGVICEERTYKNTLRIEVTGDPAVDPNDPDIRDIILRKIQEKLQVDKNFSLSWKTQSNGNIFQTKNP